ncbi:MAG: WD40 repeat domain-containing protein [Gemmataceae bacterium]|nr:WD40 repeat domain-containing protein [Gemmataceae bacterium]
MSAEAIARVGSSRLRHAAEISGLAYSPDGKTIASIDRDGVLCLWDSDSGKLRNRFTAKAHHPDALAYRHKGAELAVFGMDSCRRFDARTGKEVASFKVTMGNIAPRGWFGPNAVTLAVGGSNDLRLYDVDTGKELFEWRLKGSLVTGAAFSADGKMVGATSNDDKTIEFFDTMTGKALFELQEFTVPGLLAFSPDGGRLLVGAYSGDISQWNVATGELLPASATPPFWSVEFRDNGRWLLMGGDSFELWDWKTGKRVLRYADYDCEYRSQASMSTDGKWLAHPRAGGAIDLIDFKGQQKKQLAGHEMRCSLVRFSPDGSTLFSAGKDKAVRVWDLEKDKQRFELMGHADVPDTLVASPDGRWLLSYTRLWFKRKDAAFRVWDLKSGMLLHKVTTEDWAFQSFAFSPDGRRLAVGGGVGKTDFINDPGMVVLFDVESMQKRIELRGHERPVGVLAFSPDGRCLVTADEDWRKKIPFRYWELATGQERHRFLGHSGHVKALAFSPDGALIAAASPDAPAILWDVYGVHSKNHEAAKPWPPEDKKKLWEALGDGDAARGFQTIRQLVRNADQAVALLREHLRPVAAVDEKLVRQQLRELDSENFNVRNAAFLELKKVAGQVEALLEEEHKQNTSLETRRRLESLLAEARAPTPNRLRFLRGVEILELIGGDAATHILDTLANGAPAAGDTQEAMDARDRIRKRK